MKNNVIQKKQNLIQEYYFKLKELNQEKKAITKTINVMKEKFEKLIEVEADSEELLLFENMDDFLRERAEKNANQKSC